MPAYVPPHKLRQAAGGAAADADTAAVPADAPPSNGTSPTSTRFNTRGGGRAGFSGGFGRGGGRGWSTRPTRVNASELYHSFDIGTHYWPGTESASVKGSTFHDSDSRTDQLAYITLFKNANPRWGSDQLVFVKTNLRWLPDYQSQTDGKGEYFPKHIKRDILDDRGHSESSQEQGNIPNAVSGVDEGLEANDEPKFLEAQQDPVPAPKENIMDGHEGEEASSPAQQMPGDSVETAPDSHQSPGHKGKARQLDNIPPIDYVPNPHAPIAVFEEIRSGQFKFTGWHSVARVSVLAPNSEGLARMLQQKWERRDRFGNVMPVQRSPEQWSGSLAHQWAVVKFEKLAPDVAPAAPTIERQPPLLKPSTHGSEGEVKGVSEMLNELRLKNHWVGQDSMKEAEGHKVVEKGEATPSRLSDGVTDQRENIPPPAE
ncbi:hypothetical protein PG996_005516 [Apiospora saccharicola]|uniref:Uncharacterized protein n=1 Tax=Apiospora saccharicola TaxID=335842 RepID=A0ABR1VQQ1_9PEZI